MTDCTVYVYDDQLTAAASNFIEIREYDPFWKKLDIQMGATLGPNEFGARITLPDPPEPIVVLVDDTSRHFAPTSLAYLNGRETARLDVTLYALPLPPGGGGGGAGPRGGAVWPMEQWASEFEYPDAPPQTLDVISQHVNRQVESNNWSDTEAFAVRSLLETTVRAMTAAELDLETQEKLVRWRQQLKSLGITILAEVQVVQATERTATASS
jgi:hypothetical protein